VAVVTPGERAIGVLSDELTERRDMRSLAASFMLDAALRLLRERGHQTDHETAIDVLRAQADVGARISEVVRDWLWRSRSGVRS